MNTAGPPAPAGGPGPLAGLLPPWAAGAEELGPGPQPWLYAEEDEQLAEGVVGARWTEFAAARRCARRALLGLGAAPGPLLRGGRGEPLWPAGVVGSITHRAGYRAAVVGPAGATAALGIDAEPAVALRPGVLRRIALPAEHAGLAALPSVPGLPWDTLLFCAKEAAYKAWYPLARVPLGFHSAEVRFHPERSAVTVRPVGVRPAAEGASGRPYAAAGAPPPSPPTGSSPSPGSPAAPGGAAGLPLLEGGYAAADGLLLVLLTAAAPRTLPPPPRTAARCASNRS
ncbi:4'-phosphopantetheinyl transferase family protein [Streptomyces sp. CB02009]|uniref:4'-phosphopantetheinyl transferase family protein n=1 Tax=Streptomyces sp. CB02009 TaxID=1703938 RepID=UPI001F52948A|nr:4'-phosphopantetheinyl transferase superfamily protein [Streptomyces sp. CB02009]